MTDEPRELTDEEKVIVFGYLRKYGAQDYFYDAIHRDKYVALDLLQFAKDDKNGITRLTSPVDFQYYIYTD